MGYLVETTHCPYCNRGHNTPCFAIYNDGYHCFSCGKTKKSDKKSDFSFKITNTKHGIDLPENIIFNCSNFSTEVLKWLYRYNILDFEIRNHKIGYCCGDGKKLESSLFLPVYSSNDGNNIIEFYQQRFFPNKKFLTNGSKKGGMLLLNSKSDILVIVEDYISAIRCSKYVNTLCLFGVHMTFDMFKKIENINIKKIKIWLDPDVPGVKAAKEVKNDLIKNINNFYLKYSFAISEYKLVESINSELQPKDYTNIVLKSILENNNDKIAS